MNDNRYFALGCILVTYVIILVTAALVTYSINEPWQNARFQFFFSENGVFESLTVLLYFLTSALIWHDRQTARSVRIALILCCLFLAARELDLHTRFTGVSLLRTDFFFEAGAPVWKRLFFGVIFLAFGGYCAVALWDRTMPFLAALWRRQPAAVMLAIGFAFLPLSKSLDGGARDWREAFNLGELPEALEPTVAIVEESLEFLTPVSFLLAVLFLLAHRKRDTPIGETSSRINA